MYNVNIQHYYKSKTCNMKMSTVQTSAAGENSEDRPASSGFVERLQTSHIPSLPLSKFKGGDCRGYASDDIRMPVPQD